MSGPAAPPPSYEEAQGMVTGQAQYPTQDVPYPSEQAPYQGGKIDGYSGIPPYPPQQGYPQQSYPYGQPQGAYPPGTYVHPTVGYSPATGATVQNQGPVIVTGTMYGVMTPEAQRRKQIMIGIVIAVIIVIFFIVMFSIIF